MMVQEESGLRLLRFRRLAAAGGLRHAVFTRVGGCSTGPYAGLNVALSVGDAPEAVARNRELVRGHLGGAPLQFIEQVHGDHVVVVDGGRPPEGRPPRGDALVSAAPGLMLVTQVADCQPVFICDPLRRVAANVHCGWRGSVRNILGRTVALMAERFGCRPADMLAGIGPSLGPCCAEFVNYRREMPPELWRYRGDGDRFDFWAASGDQLRAAGLAEGNIEIAGLCTRCRTDLFYSYRAERVTGRFAAAIGFEES